MPYTSKLNKRRRQVEGSISVGKGTAIKVIVGLDGYDYKYYKRDHQWTSTKGLNVHIAMNGPLQLTFSELEQYVKDLQDLVAEAKRDLTSI